MADFDGLAAAVGLAKLWQDERPDDGEKRLPTNSTTDVILCFVIFKNRHRRYTMFYHIQEAT